jgi:hypothetical protein
MQRGRAVDRRELLAAVWPERVVGENFSQAVSGCMDPKQAFPLAKVAAQRPWRWKIMMLQAAWSAAMPV